jgi:hypothetical protein
MAADPVLARTRTSLHAVAELLMAGPQHDLSGTIRLRPVRGGFGTTQAPDVRVDGTNVVAANRRAEIDGRTARQLGEELGVAGREVSGLYHDGAGVGLDEALLVDATASARIAESYAIGDEALRALAPDQTPVLWPEHFDLGITVDKVNYGVSPGDASLDVPYMYVGPWEPPPPDDYWNQPYGAARELPGSVADVLAFFEEGGRRLSR